MTFAFARSASAALVVMALASPAQAQGLFDGMFGRNERPAEDIRPSSREADAAVEVERLEQRIRQLTGQIEQLQHRNRVLEQQLQSAGVQPGGPVAGAPAAAPLASGPVMQPGQAAAPLPPPSSPGRASMQAGVAPVVIPAPGGGRGDAFDPARTPNAPGVPQALSSIPPGSNAAPPAPLPPPDDPVGAPGGRAAGAPLDLATLSANAANEPMPPSAGGGASAPLPPPPSRRLSATGAGAPPTAAPPVVAAAPAQAPVQTAALSPKQQYDAAYGLLTRKDYAQAEQAFQSFLQRNPKDRLAGDAGYWIGESLYQRQRYEAAAERFLDVSTKHSGSSKAPDSLLRLGQSLAAMKQKEMACAAFAEVERKYPRASGSVKQTVEREQKRVRC